MKTLISTLWLTLSGLFNIESERHTNRRVGGYVVVSVTVIVDIRKVGGIASISRKNPPVGPRTNTFIENDLCYFTTYGKALCFVFSSP